MGFALKFGNWRVILEIIGFVAIVASLVFVGIELSQSRAIAIGDGNLVNAQIQVESNNAISEHSVVWTRGNSGQELTESDAVIFNNLVKNKAIHAFMEYARLDQLEFDEAADSVAAQFAVFLSQNPGALQVWLQSEEFFAQYFEVPVSQATWKTKVRSNLAMLERDAGQ